MCTQTLKFVPRSNAQHPHNWVRIPRLSFGTNYKVRDSSAHKTAHSDIDDTWRCPKTTFRVNNLLERQNSLRTVTLSYSLLQGKSTD